MDYKAVDRSGNEFEDDTIEREQLLKQPHENWRGFGKPKLVTVLPKKEKKQNYRALNSILNAQVRVILSMCSLHLN